jgi:hypothetical protein
MKRALFGSKSERQLGAVLSRTQPSLFQSKLVKNTEPLATEQISYKRNKPRYSKILPVRIYIAGITDQRTIAVWNFPGRGLFRIPVLQFQSGAHLHGRQW